MLHTLRFFSFQNTVYFIMLPFFGSCVIHILYTECAKIKKKKSGAKKLSSNRFDASNFFFDMYLTIRGKVRPMTGHEGSEGEQIYSSTLA